MTKYETVWSRNSNALFLQDVPQTLNTPHPLVSPHSDPRYATTKGTPSSEKGKEIPDAACEERGLGPNRFALGKDWVAC